MRFRLFLAAILSLPCLALVGCGNSASSTPTTTAQAGNEPLSASDAAAAQAELDQVADAERAEQSKNPVGKRAGRNR